jgi:hypothetical protein
MTAAPEDGDKAVGLAAVRLLSRSQGKKGRWAVVPIHRQYHLPVDPDCEAVAENAGTFGLDACAIASGVASVEWAAFERFHRGECERCALYGVEHMSMPEPAGFSVVSAA